MPGRLPTTTLTICLAAAAALPSAGPARAEPVPAGPEGRASTATTVASTPTTGPAPSPAQAPAQTTPQATPQTTPTAEAAPAPAPEIQRQRAQPRSGAPVSHGRRGANRSAGEPAARSGSPPPGSRSHTPAGVPFSLTPPPPTGLAGPLAGVPSFFVNSFAIPPFLLPIYQAAGADYGIPWQVLAAINEVESDYGRDLSVSSAGAEGWMQFLPATWTQYGVDVNNDGFQDPYNPADAIFAAARYLKAAGGDHDIRAAVFAYNHSQAYVQSVMLRARLLAGTPPALLSAVAGLTEARFPVYAPSHYSDGFPTGAGGRPLAGTAIYSQAHAPAIAVQDGRIAQMGDAPALGRYVSLTDAYGNTYTYAGLGALATLYPVLEGPKRFSLHPLRPGVHVLGGTVLGHLGYEAQPHIVFQIRPAGAAASPIDPKPILDGWVNLQNGSAIHARGPQPFREIHASSGQALLESKAQLQRSIERDRSIRLAPCERRLIAGGRVDRRVLADLAFLSSSGLAPTVSAASCAQVRAARAGGAASGLESVDISAIDGMPVAHARGASSTAAAAVSRLLRLQGTMRPLAIAGPRGLPKAAGVLELPGHAGRIHIAFERPSPARAHAAGFFSPGLSPAQWVTLIARLGEIPDPAVASKPSAAAIPDR